MERLYVCILCETRGLEPWVGDFDAVDEIGACPRCGWGVREAIMPADALTTHCNAERRAVEQALAAGTVDRLDPVTP